MGKAIFPRPRDVSLEEPCSERSLEQLRGASGAPPPQKNGDFPKNSVRRLADRKSPNNAHRDAGASTLRAVYLPAQTQSTILTWFASTCAS